MARVLRILLIILILLILIAVVWWFFQRNSEGDTTTNTTTNITISAPTGGFEAPEAIVVETPSDTDADGLADSEELDLGTKIDIPDTDADGLADYDEVRIYTTNPLRSDSDDDGFSDGDEVEQGFNPNGAGPLLNTQQAITDDRNQ
ncbi:MAG: hypothetical protein WCV86_00505 [Patescibacteria group bacterium]|jgi:hypothetical protein